MPLSAPAADPSPAARPVLAHSIDEAATALRVNERTVRRMIKCGELPAKKLRGRRIILDSDLRRFLDQLPAAT